MSEPKPFASLSSGLLARKGAARPAMRPQGFGQAGAGLDDLGWNDMGFEAPKASPGGRDEAHDAFGEEIVHHPRSGHSTGLSPVESPVHGQQAVIADRFAPESDEAEDEEYDETAEAWDPEGTFERDEEPALDAGENSGDAGGDDASADRDDGVHSVLSARLPSAFLEPEIEPARGAPFDPEPATIGTDVPVSAPVPVQRRKSAARSAPGSKGKAAFTLRLDSERHLKLRLACAVRGTSAQMLVTDALDQLLAKMPELDAMARNAKTKG